MQMTFSIVALILTIVANIPNVIETRAGKVKPERISRFLDSFKLDVFLVGNFE